MWLVFLVRFYFVGLRGNIRRLNFVKVWLIVLILNLIFFFLVMVVIFFLMFIFLICKIFLGVLN